MSPRSGASSPMVSGERSGSQAPTPAVRQAALLLHGLGETDRAWLLERLSEAERSTMVGLLSELASLGIPSDRAFVEEVVAAAASRAEPADAVQGAGDEPGRRVASLARASPEAIAKVLRDEPPGLVACVLRLHPWPWREAVLGHLGPVAAARIEQSMRERSPRGGAILSGRLMEALIQRVDAERSRAPERYTAAQAGVGALRHAAKRISSWAGRHG